MKLKYYNSLDGLRAIAAIGVIVAHFFTIERIKNPLLIKIAQQGNSGVSLFFVLSGFVITRILLNTVKDKKYFSNFYGRRTLRIFPLYYLGLLIYNFLPYLLGLKYSSISFDKLWYYYAYVQNIARTFNWDSVGPVHYWSLAVEEHFYLIWPAIVYFFYSNNKKKLFLISGFFIVLAFLLRIYMINKGYEINVFTLTRIDQLALGCVLALLESKGYLNSAAKKYFIVALIVGLLFVLYSATFDYFNLNLYKHSAYGLFYFGLIGYCITADIKSLFNQLLNLKVVQFLGRISYGIYIWHMIVILLVESYFNIHNLAVQFLLIMFFTVLVSAVSYYFFEMKFLKLKKYFE